MSGDDPAHDFDDQQKNAFEAELRARGRELLANGETKQANRQNARAIQISRRKSKRAHQGRD